MEVRYPYGMPRAAVDDFVDKHRTWAEGVLKRKNEERSLVLNRTMTLPFLGKEYPILPPDGGKSRFIEGKGFVLPDENMPWAAAEVYRREAWALITQRVDEIAAVMGTKYANIQINAAKTRWGSCSKNGNLHFSLFLMTAPVPCIDYVIIHELSHTVHHNHGAEFWALVERFCPERKAREEELKEVALRRRRLGI